MRIGKLTAEWKYLLRIIVQKTALKAFLYEEWIENHSIIRFQVHSDFKRIKLNSSKLCIYKRTIGKFISELISGALIVGKTYLVQKFQYENLLNFFKMSNVRSFDSKFDKFAAKVNYLQKVKWTEKPSHTKHWRKQFLKKIFWSYTLNVQLGCALNLNKRLNSSVRLMKSAT